MIKRLCGAILVLALIVSFAALFTYDVHAVSNMSASNQCVEMIKDTEGFQAIPYWDYSQWTVGFGTTCPDEYLEQYKQEGIPVEAANQLLYEQLAKFENSVNNFAKKYNLTLTQNQFDALVSFTYNLGGGVLSKESNTIVQAILAGATDNELIYAFSVYCMAGGEFLPGLMRRRLAEANMYMNGAYSEYAPASYCYVRFDANGGVRDASAQGYDANMPAEPLSRPMRSGYVFVGWYTDPVGGVKITTLDETTHGLMLYAHWQKSETEAQDPVDPTSGINVIVVSAAVHVRCGPGVGYGIVASVYAGDRLTIVGTTESNGEIWGQFSDGWICLDHTNYFEIVAPDTEDGEDAPSWQVPVYATVVDTNGIIVYNGPHTTYPQLKTLSLDTQILLLETMLFAGKQWARYEGGWVQINAKLLIHDEFKLAHNFTATTTETLTVRSGPGLSYSKESSLAKGSSHTVYSIAIVDGTPWGRVAKGWVNLNYTNFDSAKLNRYQNHTYADWYTVTSATCVTPGQERRDCQYCSHFETRETALGDHSYGAWHTVQAAGCETQGKEQRDCQYCDANQIRAIAATGHSYGAWYETKAATAEEPGQERRDCKNCDHYEVRETAPAVHNFGDWTVILAPTCTEAGQERRTCGECGYSETREVASLGHSYGQWYETVPATTTQCGQERRDCQRCDSYETRETDKLPVTTVTHTYATVTCSVLRIRSGPGTGYSTVGQLYKGDKVEVLELKQVDGNQWGRIENGWICLTGLTELTYVEEGHTSHTYGQWYTVKEASCEENGLQRRDCSQCSHYETKTLTAFGHSFGEWYESVAPTTSTYGQERRDCSRCDYFETRQTEKLPAETITRIYATVTCSLLRVRSSPSTSAAIVGSLYKGDEVEVLAIRTVNGVDWGRIESGWICLTGLTQLRYEQQAHTHDFGDWYVTKAATTTEHGQERRDCSLCDYYETRETEKLKQRVYATITCDALSIREGAGTGYARLGFYYKGTTVEILEQVQVGDDTWGRTDRGWICLTGYTTLKTIIE